jgi:hypothetical protein
LDGRGTTVGGEEGWVNIEASVWVEEAEERGRKNAPERSSDKEMAGERKVCWLGVRLYRRP